MSDNRRVRWHDSGRGARVLIFMAGEDYAMSVDSARRLHLELGRTLDEIDATTGTTNPDPRGDHRE